VTVVTAQFEKLAQAAGRAYGYEALPLFVMPANCESLPDEEICRIIDDGLAELVSKIAQEQN
jgi:hypothetical protein